MGANDRTRARQMQPFASLRADFPRRIWLGALLPSPHAPIYAVKPGLDGAKRELRSACLGFVSVTWPPDRARYRTQISSMAALTIVLRTRRKDNRGRAPVRLGIAFLRYATLIV